MAQLNKNYNKKEVVAENRAAFAAIIASYQKGEIALADIRRLRLRAQNKGTPLLG